jgi:hypothetical protein
MLYLYVLVAVLLRLLPHPWNVTPIGAMFLFSGGTFRSKRESLLVPLAALMVSDYAVVNFLYHGQYAWFSPFTWAGFLFVGLIGWTLRGKVTWARVPVASIAGSVVFFLVSNLDVWAAWKLYPRTFSGLVDCYVAALPFFRNTLFGDLAYAALMFGSYQWLKRRQLVMAVGAR